MGSFPTSSHCRARRSARRIIHRLTQDDFSAEQIAEFVTAEMCGNEIFYLYAHPTVTRQDINELAHIKYALSLPDNECLEMLAGTLAANGAKSALGYKSRDEYQDRLDFQAIAKPMWEEKPSLTIPALIDAPALAPYARKYKGRHTLRDWLSEIDPRPPEKKRGRPKTKN